MHLVATSNCQTGYNPQITPMIARIGDWIDCNAAAIQAIATLLAALFTALYVYLTFRYVKRTGEAIGLTRKQLEEQRASLALLREQVEQQKQSLKLAEKEFEREWEPDLRVALVERPDAKQTFARLANLAKPSALITGLVLEQVGGPTRDTETYPRSDLVPGGEARDLSVKTELIHYRGKYYPLTGMSGARPVLQMQMGVAFTYDCGNGRKVTTQPYTCYVRFQDWEIISLIPYP